ncbi:unnamed protein product, partial [Mycena citricolor]
GRDGSIERWPSILSVVLIFCTFLDPNPSVYVTLKTKNIFNGLPLVACPQRVSALRGHFVRYTFDAPASGRQTLVSDAHQEHLQVRHLSFQRFHRFNFRTKQCPEGSIASNPVAFDAHDLVLENRTRLVREDMCNEAFDISDRRGRNSALRFTDHVQLLRLG